MTITWRVLFFLSKTIFCRWVLGEEKLWYISFTSQNFWIFPFSNSVPWLLLMLETHKKTLLCLYLFAKYVKHMESDVILAWFALFLLCLILCCRKWSRFVTSIAEVEPWMKEKLNRENMLRRCEANF